jgi:hypothetical protein
VGSGRCFLSVEDLELLIAMSKAREFGLMVLDLDTFKCRWGRGLFDTGDAPARSEEKAEGRQGEVKTMGNHENREVMKNSFARRWGVWNDTRRVLNH